MCFYYQSHFASFSGFSGVGGVGGEFAISQ